MIYRVTMCRVVCDWPGCKNSPDDEYYAWFDKDSALDTARDYGWWFTRDDAKQYCSSHCATWASDHEDGEPYPEPPYLLIHDGDTEDSGDDGHVSLIGGDES